MREVMANPQVTSVFVKANSPPAYMDQPEFKAFWDTDAKRVEAAVQSIGKVEG